MVYTTVELMDQYKIFNNKVHEKQIVGYFRIMVAPMDPKPLQQISPKIEEWFKSEEGQWVQSYCKDLNSIKYKHYDPAVDRIVHCIKFVGYCTAEDWTYYTLKFK